MIVFLTLIYVAVLALAVKLQIIRLTTFWKSSPILWMLFLLAVLFVPMQWGAPSGAVNVYEYVVEIIPNVSGQVTEVPCDGLTALKEGDVLFQIDAEPYQAAVDQLTAQLADAEQNVKRLENSVVIASSVVTKTNQQVDIAKTMQVSATARIESATASLHQAETDRDQAEQMLADLNIQVAAAEREFQRIKDLRERDSASDSDVDRAEVQFTRLSSQRDVAKLDVTKALEAIAAATASLTAAKADSDAADLQLKQLVDGELPRVRAELRDAELAANARIGDEHTSVATARAQLDKALYELKETTVRAPSNGYVVGNTLRPGQRVSNMPFRAAMSFIDSKQTRLAVGIQQFALRNVRAGDKVEVTLKLYPGQVLTGQVDSIAWVTSQGQLAPSGNVPNAPGGDQKAMPFGVTLKLDPHDTIDVENLPGGAMGTAAVYTSRAKLTHVIRKVMLRMDAWMNYIVPW